MKLQFDAEERKPVGQGYKLVRVGKVEFALSGPDSKVPGTPMLKVQYKVKEGAYEGRTLFQNLMLAGGGTWRTARDLQAIRPDIDWAAYDLPEAASGETEDGLDNEELIAQIVEDLIDEDAIVLVAHEPYKGKLDGKVKEVLPANAAVALEDDAA